MLERSLVRRCRAVSIRKVRLELVQADAARFLPSSNAPPQESGICTLQGGDLRCNASLHQQGSAEASPRSIHNAWPTKRPSATLGLLLWRYHASR